MVLLQEVHKNMKPYVLFQAWVAKGVNSKVAHLNPFNYFYNNEYVYGVFVEMLVHFYYTCTVKMKSVKIHRF